MQVYLVGGAVRDSLLGLPVTERDWVVVGSSADELLTQGYQQVGKDFPVFLHPQTSEEYALARTERKSGKGYYGFEMHADPDVTLEQDLLRRDLTINAMAQDKEGQLVDPYHGANDLEQRWLRHVSPAFQEDPLRVLRIARFAARYHALGFRIAPETQQLMRCMAQSGELDALVPERVWAETVKALKTAHPAVYFQVLRDCGALHLLFPELDRLFGIQSLAPSRVSFDQCYPRPQVDSGAHSLSALQAAVTLTSDIAVRFSALFLSVGKGAMDPAMGPSYRGYEEMGESIIRALCQRLRVPNDIRDLALFATLYHLIAHDITDCSAEQIVYLFDKLDVWRKPERLDTLLLICEADMRGQLDMESVPYPAATYLPQAYEITKTVQVADVIADGFQKEHIRYEMTRRRICAVFDWQRGYKLEDDQ